MGSFLHRSHHHHHRVVWVVRHPVVCGTSPLATHSIAAQSMSAAAVAGSSVYLLFIESFLLKMRRLSKVCGVGVRVIFEYVVVV